MTADWNSMWTIVTDKKSARAWNSKVWVYSERLRSLHIMIYSHSLVCVFWAKLQWFFHVESPAPLCFLARTVSPNVKRSTKTRPILPLGSAKSSWLRWFVISRWGQQLLWRAVTQLVHCMVFVPTALRQRLEIWCFKGIVNTNTW